jgi:hypothetical protein
MKALKTTNTIAISIPVLLILFGFIYELGFYLAIYSTIITGLLQIIIGINFIFKFKNNFHIKLYFILVILFFCLWYFNENIYYTDRLTWPLIYTPLVLSIYISIIIYSKKKES